jgi:hypothetical protein
VHPKLIKANIALFNGARSETRRLLDEYRTEEADAKPTPMMMWLDAQAQDTRDERIERLHVLLEEKGENSRYARYAKEYIDDERKYGDKPLLGLRRGRGFEIVSVPVGKVAFFIVLGAMVGFVLFSALNPGGVTLDLPVSTAVVTNINGTQVATPTFPPVVVTQVEPPLYQAEYAQGILQISEIEPVSQRVLDSRDRTILTPFVGARFYAVKLIFRCQMETCNQPPEARLRLELSNGDELDALPPNVIIVGEDTFHGIARGTSTNGWVVFQIADDSTPVRLIIQPLGAGGTEPTPEPVSIDLPE